MIELINFDNWDIHKQFEASGCSEKDWLINPEDGRIGLFKYPKKNKCSSVLVTFEYISEHLASRIAEEIGVSCCKVDIGTFNGRIGCLSHLVHDYTKDTLVDGVRLLEVDRPNYDSKKMIDRDTGEVYSIDMIVDSLFSNETRQEFLKVPILDLEIVIDIITIGQ